MRITKVLCALLFFSSAVSAQTSEARTEYLNWKKQVSVTLQDTNHLYTFQVAVAVQRTDKTHIHVLVGVVGRTPNYTFKLQPINAIQFFDVDQDVRTTGKSDDWGAGQDTRVPRLGYLLDFDKVIECEEETNAVFVSIKPVPNKGQPRETTTLKIIVPLEDKWHFDKKDFFVPREQIDKTSPNESLNSYFLPDSTAKLVTLSGKVLRSDRNDVIENAYILLMQEKEPGGPPRRRTNYVT